MNNSDELTLLGFLYDLWDRHVMELTIKFCLSCPSLLVMMVLLLFSLSSPSSSSSFPLGRGCQSLIDIPVIFMFSCPQFLMAGFKLTFASQCFEQIDQCRFFIGFFNTRIVNCPSCNQTRRRLFSVSLLHRQRA